MLTSNEIEFLSPSSVNECENTRMLTDAIRTVCNILMKLANPDSIVCSENCQPCERAVVYSSSTESADNTCFVPISDRLLLNFREASAMLSMSEQSLRDLVHKGQGPENLRRGKRVCFTREGLEDYVAKLPRQYPYQGIIETINTPGSKPATMEEQRAFNV